MLMLYQLVSAALLWFYSVTFKKQVLIGNLIIALLTALVPFTAGYYEVAVMFDYLEHFTGEPDNPYLLENLGSLLFSIKYLLYWIIGYSAFAFLLTMCREIVKDMEDIEGDRAYDCKTLPIVFGIKRAKQTAIGIALLTTVGLLLINYLQFISQDWISLTYFVLLLVAPLIWVMIRLSKAQKKKHYFVVSQGIKIIMLFGILYTVMIYLF